MSAKGTPNVQRRCAGQAKRKAACAREAVQVPLRGICVWVKIVPAVRSVERADPRAARIHVVAATCIRALGTGRGVWIDDLAALEYRSPPANADANSAAIGTEKIDDSSNNQDEDKQEPTTRHLDLPHFR